MGDISKSFSWREFACNDGTPVPEDLKQNVQFLVEEILQPLRDQLGKPVNIISGYRTPEYNRRCGGVRRSQHLKALAADIQIHGMPSSDDNLIVRGYMMARLKFTGKGGGVGFYKTFTHVDARRTQRVSFWDKT